MAETEENKRRHHSTLSTPIGLFYDPLVQVYVCLLHTHGYIDILKSNKVDCVTMIMSLFFFHKRLPILLSI